MDGSNCRENVRSVRALKNGRKIGREDKLRLSKNKFQRKTLLMNVMFSGCSLCCSAQVPGVCVLWGQPARQWDQQGASPAPAAAVQRQHQGKEGVRQSKDFTMVRVNSNQVLNPCTDM